MGALHVIQARLGSFVVSVVLVALQLVIMSDWRIAGAVVVVPWMWAFALGLSGQRALAVGTGVVTGLLLDAHLATPFGASAVLGALTGWVASALGREGVGDLDSAAWWVTPGMALVTGLVAPLVFVIVAAAEGSTQLYQNGLLSAMLVNALGFAVLARPLARLGLLVTARLPREAR
ncbi:MAG: hypothetical protein KGR42_05595 [Acidobacteria bacterium]|nr:hypothetical protein [Acidobacteriota bacterium]